MKELNNKIKESIAYSGRLRQLAKDGTLPKDKTIGLYKKVQENDEKIKFLKQLSNALKK